MKLVARRYASAELIFVDVFVVDTLDRRHGNMDRIMV